MVRITKKSALDRCNDNEDILVELKTLAKMIENPDHMILIESMISYYEEEQEKLDEIYFNSPEYKEWHPEPLAI